MSLSEYEKWCERKLKGKTAKKTQPNSTLPFASKPMKAKGKRGERLAADDQECRHLVFARDSMCVVCDLFGRPDVLTRTGPDEWAHMKSRNLMSEDERRDIRLQVRLCRSHHDWHHGRGAHALHMRLEGDTQIFTVDGEYSQERTV